jgi:hypothetical protein
VLGVGSAWGQLLNWAKGPEPPGAQYAGAPAVLPLAAALVALAALARLPRRWGEWWIGLAAAAAVVAGAGLIVAAGRAGTAGAGGPLGVVLSGLHLPEYLFFSQGEWGLWLLRQGPSSAWLALPEGLRRAALDENLLAAFPLPVLALALVGPARLPRRWREWCLAVLASAGLVAFGMITLTSGTPHPRLVYLAYPGFYLLAASGLLNVCHLVSALLSRSAGVPAPIARGAGVAVTLLCLSLVVAASNASLWGDLSFDLRFHSPDLFWGERGHPVVPTT